MGFADIIDAALSTQPGYRQAALWPQQQREAQLANEHSGLINQALSSNVDTLQRQEDQNARTPGQLARWYQAAAAQPGTIDRPGAMDLNENPEAAGTPAPVSPGQPAIRTMQDLMARMPPTAESAPYLTQAGKDLGLITPEAQQQKGTEEEVRQAALEGAQARNIAAQRGVGLTDAIEQALESGDVGKARVLGAVLSASKGDTKDLDLILRTQGQDGAGGPQPQAMDVGGERWVMKPNAQGLPTWQREQNPVLDWIEAHPKEVAGLSPGAARDKAGRALDIQKKTDAARIHIDIAQPMLKPNALEDAADYVIQRGKLPSSLGMGNARLRQQILDRASEKWKEIGEGPLNLAGREANYKANEAELTRLQTQRGPVVTFMNTANRHLDRADQLSKQVDRTQMPILNRFILAGETNWAGDPKAAEFAAVTQQAVTEVAKVISSTTGGGGVVSDAARKEVEGKLQPAFATGQFSAVSQALRGLMADKEHEYQATIDATNKRMQLLGGVAPAAAAPAATSGIPSFAEWKARQGR